MKLPVVIALMCFFTVSHGRYQAKYTDKWDNINLDEVLESPRLLKAYVDCLMDRGRCPPTAATLKETLPDVLLTGCSKCTEKQQQGAEKVIKMLVNKHPKTWKELSVKFDPDNKYSDKYKDRFEKVKL